MTRPELDIIQAQGYKFDQAWQVVDIFERKVAAFFNARYAVATDCCTHALELSLCLLDQRHVDIRVPLHTYMSVPMMLDKINHTWHFHSLAWHDTYGFDPLPVIDAARSWQKNSYVAGTLTCLSFQFRKHLAIGRGGMILTDDVKCYERLQRMVRDGRDRQRLWIDDDVTELGYHYYMTPEDAARGILLFDLKHDQPQERSWGWQDYRALTEFSLFQNRLCV